jgi:oxepin-CoA hydrolase/3-oxo-5,6-dehydrosuberyl-CoA semialdehyde dehydrogenase
MGGVRGVKHYMQRTAIQSSPTMIAAITEQYIPGGPKHVVDVHPFRRKMSELTIDDTWKTGSRTVSIADIEHFAEFTGDKFYAHMDEEAAKASPIFEGRVAHGYLILSFAAGLFVHPDPGPVLANTGLENLRFLTPLYPDDSLEIAQERGHRRGPLGGRGVQPEERVGRDLRSADRERTLRRNLPRRPFVSRSTFQWESEHEGA